MTPPRLLAACVSCWHDDPFARGAWSVLTPGASGDTRERLGRPVSARLMICGEATHPTHPAMTHGAWEEGLRAAEWCLAQGHRSAVVAGAGFAGLATARRLADAGLEVVVVEARDRLGGRAWSRPLGPATVEAGANWLQQRRENTLRALAEARGFALVPTDFGAPLDLGPSSAVAAISQPGLSDALAARLAAASPEARVADVLSTWAPLHALGGCHPGQWPLPCSWE